MLPAFVLHVNYRLNSQKKFQMICFLFFIYFNTYDNIYETRSHFQLQHRDELSQNNLESASDGPARPTDFQLTNYVDDFCMTSDDSAELIKQSEWIRWFLNLYGFSSDKFASNVENSNYSMEAQKYLSYIWNPVDDTISIKSIEPIKLPDLCRVRDVAKCVMSLHDPLGLALKEQLQGRMIARMAFRERRNESHANIWDQQISTDTEIKLRAWNRTLNTVQFCMPRMVDMTILFICCDASQDAWVYEIRDSEFRLIFSRGGLSKVNSTIPSTELLALYQAIIDVTGPFKQNYPDVKELIFFSDSECTLYRLRRPSIKMTKAETTKVNKMRDLINTSEIPIRVVHISGEINPGDFATRPFSTKSRPDIKIGLLKAFAHDSTTVFFDKSVINLSGEDNLEENIEDEIGYLDLNFDAVKRVTLRSQAREARRLTNETDQRNPIEDVPTRVEEPVKEDQIQITAIDNEIDEDPTQLRIKQIRASQELHLKQLIEKLDNGTISDTRNVYTVDQYNLIRRNGRVILPSQDVSLINQTIDRIHSKTHWGITQNTRKIAFDYYWPNLSLDVKRYVRNRPICQKTRTYRSIRTTAGNVQWIGDPHNIPIGGIVGIDILIVDRSPEMTLVC